MAPPRAWTRDEFLEWEIRQDERWEFIQGQIRMMAGGSADHNTRCLRHLPPLRRQVEVVSRSSREDDYAGKWEGYQRIPDLRHYVIVSQDEPAAVLYSRAGNSEEWRFRRIEGLNAAIDLAALGVVLAMAEIFEGTSAAHG